MNDSNHTISVLLRQPSVSTLTGDMGHPRVSTRFPLRGPAFEDETLKDSGGGRGDLPRLDDWGPFVAFNLGVETVHATVKSSEIEAMFAKELIDLTSGPIVVTIWPFNGDYMSFTNSFTGDFDKVLPDINEDLDMASDLLPSRFTLLAI